MKTEGLRFNPPPGWPKPPEGWTPPANWAPDPRWPTPPEGWQLWMAETTDGLVGSRVPSETIQKCSADLEPRGNGTTTSSAMEILEAENEALRRQLASAGDNSEELIVLDDERVLQSVGIYRYHHPLEHAAAYKDKLEDLGAKIAKTVTAEKAILISNLFTFDNSLAKGRKMTSDLSKLMLRAYNAEAENSIRSLRIGNVVTAKKRLEASRKAIAKLGSMMEMLISDEFHALRLEEIELTADWLMKKQEEKEIAKEERLRLREERRVEKELAEERERLDKEKTHIMNALSVLLASGGKDSDLEKRLAQIDEAIAQNDFRSANVRAGYVYVISNRGAFGPNIVKIGLTRRLEPLERISELSGASVPFRFDVHALYFSEDAVTLENELHKYFADRAVNMANSRKEFFFASPSEVKSVLIDKVGNLLEFNELAEATEFLQSTRYWPAAYGQPGPKL